MNQGTPDNLLTIDEVAMRLRLKRRGIECMMKRRAIPYVRLSHRCIRFRWHEVEAALTKMTVVPVGERRK